MSAVRKWSRPVHRDLSFFFSGVLLIYAVSGFMLNHKRDFNSDYSVRRTELVFAQEIPRAEQEWTRARAEELLLRVGEEAVAGAGAAGEQRFGGGVLQLRADAAAQGARAVGGVEAALRQQIQRRVRHLQLHAQRAHALPHRVRQAARDAPHVRGRQAAEDYRVVHAVQKLGPEGLTQLRHDRLAHGPVAVPRRAGKAQRRLGTLVKKLSQLHLISP